LIRVHALTSDASAVVIQSDDGTELGSFVVPSGTTALFELPDDPALIGHTVTTTATTGSLIDCSENPVCDGAPVGESQETSEDAAPPVQSPHEIVLWARRVCGRSLVTEVRAEWIAREPRFHGLDRCGAGVHQRCVPFQTVASARLR
jgi:hypothetical protein